MDNGKQPGRGYSYLMMAGHICCDMSQSAAPALLPFLVAQRGIDYTAAAGLMFANTFLSSLLQPLLGMIADRRRMHWLMGVGILMSSLGIASIAFMNSYTGIFIAIMIAGVGAAFFHPEGGRMANYVAGDKKGRGVSIFAAGGNIGFVIGPIGVAAAVSALGIPGVALVQIPTLLMAIVFFSLQKKFVYLSTRAQREEKEKTDNKTRRDDWPGFFRLCISVFARGIVQNGINTFVPLYWVGVLMQTQERGALMVTVMALASATAAFIGGPLADRFGFRRVVRIAIAAIAPLVILMLMIKSVWLATVVIIPLMGMVSMAHSPSVVLGQKYLPNRLGFASGVTIGLYVSIGGIFSPLLGKVGDNHGLHVTFYVVAAVAVIGFIGALLIKTPERKE